MRLVCERHRDATTAPRDQVAREDDLRVRHRDGSWRTFEVRSHNLLNDPYVEGVVVNARDITDVRDAKQSQRRLNAFLEATPDFVAIFDPHGRAFSVNQAFRRAAGIAYSAMATAVIVLSLSPAMAA